MQKITLQQNETIEINGAIINLKIVDMLTFLQSDNESGSYCTHNDGKIGIESFREDYDDLTIFLASEAGNIENKEELAAFLCSISYMKIRWNEFYISNLQQ